MYVQTLSWSPILPKILLDVFEERTKESQYQMTESDFLILFARATLLQYIDRGCLSDPKAEWFYITPPFVH